MKSNAEQFLSNAIFSAFMMSNLVNDLLDLGKLENSAFQLDIGQFNLVKVVEDVFSIVCFQAENKDISLVFAVEAESPGMLMKCFGD